MNQKQIEEIRARCERATSGSWIAMPAYWWEGRAKQQDAYGIEDGNNEVQIVYADGLMEEKDATFCAHARQDVPALLDALEEAQTEIAQLKVALSDAESSAEHWCETSAGFVDEIRMVEAENERLQREVGRLRRERDIALGLEGGSDR